MNKKHLGNPLTIEQLQEMLENDDEIIGATIIVSTNGVLMHAVLDSRVGYGICAVTGANKEWLKEKDYGKTWTAYTYLPISIDLDAWGCDICCSSACEDLVCLGYRYCPKCGKPMTEEKWHEFEERIGVTR